MNRKVAIVTGASSGLGLELAMGLIAQNHFVVGISRRKPTDPRWAQFIKEQKIIHVLGDVSLENTVKEAITAADHFGEIDTVINCAGVGVFGPAISFSREDIDNVMRGNLIGMILFSEAAMRKFKSSSGTIVNIMSTAAQVARPNEAIYCAAKWGAKGYTETLRLEAKGTGVRVIAVYPGGMKTRFWTEAKGSNVDPSTFMPAAEVASMIISALTKRDNGYTSDIVINRL